MLRRLSVANVRVCSSEIVVGGGVFGGAMSNEDTDCFLL